jgi:hypothetical protein
VLLPIDDERRATLSRIAAMLLVTAVGMVAPALDRSWSAYAAVPTAPVERDLPALPGWEPYPTYALRRDPFAAPIGTFAGAFAASTTGASAATSGGGPLLRAVIVGSPSRALIEIGGRVQVFAPGDTIGTTEVDRVNAAGVDLRDGTHLTLAEQP